MASALFDWTSSILASCGFYFCVRFNFLVLFLWRKRIYSLLREFSSSKYGLAMYRKEYGTWQPTICIKSKEVSDVSNENIYLYFTFQYNFGYIVGKWKADSVFCWTNKWRISQTFTGTKLVDLLMESEIESWTTTLY